MVISKPAPFLNFTPTLEWLENMRGTTPEAEEYIAQKTDFLMEIFKFMPKAAAYKFDKGANAKTGSLGMDKFSGMKVDDGTEIRPATAGEITSLLTSLRGSKVIYNVATYQITDEFAAKIENGTADESSFAIPGIWDCDDNKRKILLQITKAYYAGKNGYEEFRPYNEQYSYDIANSGTVYAPGGNGNGGNDWAKTIGENTYNQSDDLYRLEHVQFPGATDTKRTYINSESVYGFGLTHRQTEVGTSKGSQLYLSDVYKWFNGAGDFKWSPDAVTGINSVIPIYDKESPTFTNVYNKDFYPTDYTNMIFGLNPTLIRNRYGTPALDSLDLPEVSGYGNLFNRARADFSGNSKNYYDIIKTREFESYNAQKMVSLFILMLESKRRFLYGMTEMLGPFTQGKGFADYVDRDYYTEMNADGAVVFRANKTDPDATVPTTLHTNITVDDYMMGRFSHFYNDERVKKVSGYKTSFLSIFYENAHEFMTFFAALTKFQVGTTPVWDYGIFSYADGLAIKAFSEKLETSWADMLASVKPTTTLAADYFTNAKTDINDNIANIQNTGSEVNLDIYIQRVINKLVQLRNTINPSNWDVPTYNLYRLYDQTQSCIDSLYEAKAMQVDVEDEVPDPDQMAAKKDAAVAAASVRNSITENDITPATNGLPDMEETIRRIESGDSFLELKNEFTQVQGSAKYQSLPTMFKGWDYNNGNFIANNPDGIYLGTQYHYYSPVQQRNNFPAGGPNKTSALKLNYNARGSGSTYSEFSMTDIPYNKVWGTRVMVDLGEAYMFEEIMRFAIKNLWNKPRKRSHKMQSDEYYRQRDMEHQIEKSADAAAKKKQNVQRKILADSEKKHRSMRKKREKLTMKHFLEKMRDERKARAQKAANPPAKPKGK